MHRGNVGNRVVVVVALLVLLVLGSVPAAAGPGDGEHWLVIILQQSFPKQTTTNNQIEQINDTFGANFETWDDVVNLSVGGKLFWEVNPRWLVGTEVDYSAGAINGEATVDTAAGPATLSFEQKYSVYADALAIAHFLPCRNCEKVVPFVLGGAGLAYEKDRTTLNLTNDYVNEWLRVDNDGTFWVATLGAGVNVPFGAMRTWYVELGGAYYWGRLKHHVPALGTLAPAPEVLADTDSTGPNYWVGLGRKF